MAMKRQPPIHAVTADETGLCKDVRVEDGIVKTWGGGQSRARGVDQLCWLGDAVVAALHNGALQLWHPRAEDSPPAQSVGSFSGRSVGMDELPRCSTPSIVLCNDEGTLQVLAQAQAGAGAGADADEDHDAELMAAQFEAAADWAVGGPVHRMRLEASAAAVAVGGNERDLSVWSLDTQQELFRARNVPHDKLDLRQPVWVTDAQFMACPGGGRFEMVTTTGYSQIRLYDTGAQRQPVHSVKVGEYPLSACALNRETHSIFVGDTTGGLYALDMRTWKSLGRFVGPCGAVRDLSCVDGGTDSAPLLCSVGLDRFLHVFSQRSRKLQHKLYLKQRLTAVLTWSEAAARSRSRARSQHPEGAATSTSRAPDGAAKGQQDSEEDSDSEAEAYDDLEYADSDSDSSADEEEEEEEDEDEEEAQDLAVASASRKSRKASTSSVSVSSKRRRRN